MTMDKTQHCRLLSISLFILIGLMSNSVYAEKTLNEIVPVTIVPLSELLFHPLKKAPAQVISLQNSLLSSQLSALIQSVAVQVGDRVQTDQVLVRLECEDFELTREQLQAEKKALQADQQFARYQFERSRKLLKTRSVSEESHQQQRSALHRLDARLQLIDSKIKLAEKNITRCLIRAPFDGVITQRLVHKGENVSPGTHLLRLMNTRQLEVEVQVPVGLVDDLNYKTLDFVYRKQHYPLSIRAIVPSIETRARHQRVRLSFSGKKAQPNAFGMVEITLQEQHIPANVLVSRNNQLGIFVAVAKPDGRYFARFQPLKNALTGRSARIERDTLPADSKIIIQGRQALNDQQAVELINSQSSQ